MFRSRSLRLTTLSLLFLGFANLPARAESKEMIQLQTQVQQLQDAVARLQQSNDERMGVLRDLVQQTADSVNRMSSTVTGLKSDLGAQQTAAGGRNDQLAGQIQSLNDSLDELKARMARMEKSLTAIQSQQQSANALLTNLPQPGAPGPSASPSASPSAGPSPSGPSERPAPGSPIPMMPAAGNPPPADMYSTAYGDYMAAKYPLAASEFDSLVKAYPDDNLSGNASFYLGEINLKTGKPTLAVRFYDRVLEHYPDNNKIPVAHLHKAEAMLSMKQNDGAVRELRTLIQRFPVSPEAAQARQRLSAMHVAVAAPAR